MNTSSRIRKVIAEYQGAGYWLTVDDNGRVAEYESAEMIAAAVRKRDLKAAKRASRDILTFIDYRNVPDGFELPT